jgi:hypothetical protein
MPVTRPILELLISQGAADITGATTDFETSQQLASGYKSVQRDGDRAARLRMRKD